MLQEVKRGIVAALAIAMAATVGSFGLASTANADEASQSSGDITISGLSGSKVKVDAYKIIDEQVGADNAPIAPGLTWDSTVAEWISSNSNQDYRKYIGENNTVSKTYQDIVSDSTTDPDSGIDANTHQTIGNVAKFLDDLANSRKLPSNPKSVTSDGQDAITLNLPVGGYYIEITSTYGPYVYRAIAANVIPEWNETTKQWEIKPQTVVAKRSKAGMDKVINGGRDDDNINTGKDNKDQGSDTASIGETVNFDLYTDVPVYPSNAINKKYLISDVMKESEGLTFGKIVKVEATKDTNSDSKNYKTLAAGDAYTLNTPGKDANGNATTFTLDFNYEKIRGYRKIHVAYTATVNENAKPGQAMVNDAKLQYSNNPYTNEDFHTEEDKTKVYTFGIRVIKVGEENERLTGAEFTLADSGENVLAFVKVGDGEYRRATNDDKDTTTNLAVNDQGELRVYGLKGADDKGKPLTYKLSETKAPGGYLKLTKPIPVTLTPQQDNNKDYTGTLGSTTDAGYVTETVKNQKSGTLPKTGGIGTIIFSVLGALMVAGGVLLIGSRRKKNA